MVLHSRDIAPSCPDLRYAKRIEVKLRDRRWRGWWDVCSDRKLHVSSAYGSRTEPVGRRRNLEKRAKELLEEIVRNFSFNPVPEIHQTRKRR